VVTEGSTVTTTDYLTGFQYINNKLEFFPHAEGYVKNVIDEDTGFGATNNIYRYVYNYTDHLGNVRLTYTKHPITNVLTILEENNYYPFGLKHRNYNMGKKQYEKLQSTGGIVITPTNETVYDYKYNGKECQDELGLNFYDYGARNYDPAIGRWMNIDPLAENSRRWNPYNYAYNNPMYFVDPDGMQAGAAKDLNSGDFDTMVEVGYGRVVKSSHLTGKVDFYGGDQVLNDKGKDKVIDTMLDNLSENPLNIEIENTDTDPPKGKKAPRYRTNPFVWF